MNLFLSGDVHFIFANSFVARFLFVSYEFANWNKLVTSTVINLLNLKVNVAFDDQTNYVFIIFLYLAAPNIRIIFEKKFKYKL